MSDSDFPAFGLGLQKGVGDWKGRSLSSPDWNLLKEEVSLPAAVIDLDRLEHNLEWMQNFVNLYNFELSPHGKTSMSPGLFKRQMAHGAWGITLATAQQTKVAWTFGIQRVLLANQLVGLQNMEIIAGIQGSDPEFDFICILDSAENAKALGEFFARKKQVLKILLEYGVEGGRTGVRSDKEEEAVLEEIRKWGSSLRLVGVEFYEGISKGEREVRELIRRVVSRFLILLEQSAFGVDTALISGSGSCWYDVVAEELSFLQDLPLNSPTISHYGIKVVLRPGCYVTHGLGLYEDIEKRLMNANPLDGNPLEQSLSLWAYVQSKPEEGSVIIGMGKREVLDDCGLPVPYYHFQPGKDSNGRDVRDISRRGWRLSKLMDQHAFMGVDGDSWRDIRIGDIVIFHVCHPCTTFDKWKCILGADGDFNVKEVFQTYF